MYIYVVVCKETLGMEEDREYNGIVTTDKAQAEQVQRNHARDFWGEANQHTVDYNVSAVLETWQNGVCIAAVNVDGTPAEYHENPRKD